MLDETAQVYGIEARRISYPQTLAEVKILIGAYISAGVASGHRVGLMLENRPEFFFHWFALNALGASAVPLNADWRGAELEYVIGHSEVADGDRSGESRGRPDCRGALLRARCGGEYR